MVHPVFEEGSSFIEPWFSRQKNSMEFSSMLDADWNTRFSIINELVQPPSLVLPYIILFKLNIGISLSHFNSYNLICSKNVHNSHRLILEANADYVVIVESPEHQGLTQKDNAQRIIRDQPMINLLARINQLHKKGLTPMTSISCLNTYQILLSLSFSKISSKQLKVLQCWKWSLIENLNQKF